MLYCIVIVNYKLLGWRQYFVLLMSCKTNNVCGCARLTGRLTARSPSCDSVITKHTYRRTSGSIDITDRHLRPLYNVTTNVKETVTIPIAFADKTRDFLYERRNIDLRHFII